MTMASNYNGQPRPAEIVVEAGTARIGRRRETWEDLLSWETGTATPVTTGPNEPGALGR
jgi:hypothetical protein